MQRPSSDLLAVMIIAALSTGLALVLPADSIVRMMCALPLVLFLPGYAIAAALFPPRSLGVPEHCADLRDNYLAPFGMATNYSNVACGISKKDFQTGNFLNYVQLTGGVGGSRPRYGLQNGIIHSYINTTNGVRFAVMTSNTDKDGKKVIWDSNKEKVFGDNRDDPLDAVGGKLLGFVDENKNGKTDLFNVMSGYKNETWSPLAETLYEAGVYLQGKRSAITGTNYTSPVQYYCQKNYILIISDGDPTKDSDPRLKDLGVIDDLNNNGRSI